MDVGSGAAGTGPALVGPADGGGAGADANSANDEAGFHSPPSAACTRVAPLIRFSRSHRCIWARSTGPYSFPSPPMILYMAGSQEASHRSVKTRLERKRV